MSWTTALFWTVVIYFLPAIVAYVRNSGWKVMSFFVTLFFGWTIIGWLAGWFFAFHKRIPRHAHIEFREVRH
jgi:hypothetical protein